MEDEPINQNYLIGCDTIENSPSYHYTQTQTQPIPLGGLSKH